MEDIPNLINFHENKKIKFLKTVRGQRAVNMVKKMWFDDKNEATEWFEPLDNKNYKYGLLIYEKKKITKKYIGFKFIVYDDYNKKLISVLGQYYEPDLFPLKKF